MNTKNSDDLSVLKRNIIKYPDKPEDAVLEVFNNPSKDNAYRVSFETSEFTSLCPITSQPDFADIIIQYKPDLKCIESKSLKLYLFSFRNYGGFAEDIVNKILDDIVEACKPYRAKVTGIFTARGGIKIKVDARYKKNRNEVEK
ncbi:preQ(1) synthase [Elusimicrobiota bacterium]